MNPKTPQPLLSVDYQDEFDPPPSAPPLAKMAKKVVVRRKRKNLVGLTFERMTVIAPAPDWVSDTGKVHQIHAQWLCRCVCGNEKVVMGGHLKKGAIRSCGCLRDEKTRVRFRTHGNTAGGFKVRTYRIWCAMKTRCTNVKQPSADNYVNRGIAVCAEWLNSYESFLADLGDCPSSKHTIDRKDVNGAYCKENCKWATWKEQANNKRNSHFLEHNGEHLTISQWADRLGVTYSRLFSRIRKGMATSDALTQPFQ